MPETEPREKPKRAPKGYARRIVAATGFERREILQYNQDGTVKRKHDKPPVDDIDAELDIEE